MASTASIIFIDLFLNCVNDISVHIAILLKIVFLNIHIIVLYIIIAIILLELLQYENLINDF